MNIYERRKSVSKNGETSLNVSFERCLYYLEYFIPQFSVGQNQKRLVYNTQKSLATPNSLANHDVISSDMLAISSSVMDNDLKFNIHLLT